MKKISFLIIFLLITINNVFAYNDWYLRSDGGTPTRCDGIHDAADPGSGTGQPCALKNYTYLVSNNGTILLQPGDSVHFDATTAIGLYQVGFNVDGIVDGGNVDPTNGVQCYAGSEYGCNPAPIPSGPDADHPTRLLGKGWDTGCAGFGHSGSMSQLWGSDRVGKIIDIAGNTHIQIKCLEVTDHSACIENGPSDGTVDGFPVQCNRSSSPYGAWAAVPIQIAEGATDILFKDVYIHGMAGKGVYTGRIGNVIFDHTWMIANALVGWDGDLYGRLCTGSGTCPTHTDSSSCLADGNSCRWDDNSNTGHVKIQNNSKIDYQGCGERYPLQDTTNALAVANFHHCWGQTQNGYGDGIGLGNGNTGDITVADSSISHNTSDGGDFLHGDGTSGTVKVIRSIMEGNAGNQFKTATLNTYIENSFLIGNCGYHLGQTFTSTKHQDGSSVAFGACRAGGNTIEFQAGPNKKMYIKNTTITGNGDVLIDVSGSGCNGGTVLDWRTSIAVGGKQFADDTGIYPGGGDDTTDLYYSGEGTAGCESVVLAGDYNLVSGTKNIASDTDCSVGGHNICNVDPLFTGTIKQGPFTSPGYYTAANYKDQLYLQPTSPAKYSGVAGLTFQDGPNDFNNYTRPSVPSIGGFEFGSVVSGTTLPTVNSVVSGIIHGYFKP